MAESLRDDVSGSTSNTVEEELGEGETATTDKSNDNSESAGLWYYTKKIGSTSYNALYYVGGKLAYFFGISTPEWQYAIDVYEDMKRKEEEEKREEEEMIKELEERVAQKLSNMEEAL